MMLRVADTRLPAAIAAVLVLAASCGGGDESESGNVASTPTSTVPPTTATLEVADSPESPDSLFDPEDLVVTRDVPYGEDRGDGFNPSLLDVYAPPSGGSWPVVVMFHQGVGAGVDKSESGHHARNVAARGAVVFAPNHGGTPSDPGNIELHYLEDGGVSCATSFALAHAGDYGGDPDLLVLAGRSGGATYSAIVATADDPPGADYCLVDPAPVSPERLVLWEGDWVLAPWWNAALAASPGYYSDEWVLNHLRSGTDTTWFVMTGSPERTSPGLAIDDPYGSGDECGPSGGATCSFLELRDPTGELREEMGELGFYDDGWLTITESSVLLAERLERAGIPHELLIFEGESHEMTSLHTQQTYYDLILTGHQD